jgi:hypothetical protein
MCVRACGYMQISLYDNTHGLHMHVQIHDITFVFFVVVQSSVGAWH